MASKHTTLRPFLQDSHLQPGCPVLQWSGHLTTTDSTLYKTPPCTPFTGLTHTLSSLNVKPTQSPQTPLHCLGQTPHCTPHLISPNTSHKVPNIIMYTLHTLFHIGSLVMLLFYKHNHNNNNNNNTKKPTPNLAGPPQSQTQSSGWEEYRSGDHFDLAPKGFSLPFHPHPSHITITPPVLYQTLHKNLLSSGSERFKPGILLPHKDTFVLLKCT